MTALLDRLKSPGPKKILSLDGGGIRGSLTLGYLQKLEDILVKKYNNPDLVLSDYFDLIGGTSTGSIIAGALALGNKVEIIRQNYMQMGGVIFGDKRHAWNPFETAKWLKARYNDEPFKAVLQGFFKDITIGGPELKTGLCIVAKRADTNSTWPIINHPEGMFYNSDLGKNKDIPLWAAIRASSAAPTYFEPVMIDVGNSQPAAFIDGGVSMANNPALTLLMVATLNGFPFKWDMGPDKLQIVSIGTGYSVYKKMTGEIDDANMLDWAAALPNMLMHDASWQNNLILQWLSVSPTAQAIDMEIGDMKNDHLAGEPRISYLRYNYPMTQASVSKALDREINDEELKSIIDIANGDSRFDLYTIGLAAGADIKESHFQNF